MSPTTTAIQAGLVRGWTLFRIVMTSPAGIANVVISYAVPLAYLVVMRNSTFPGTDRPMVEVVLPGLLAVLVLYGAISAPGYYLAAEREDGTLLRAKAVPNGMRGYVTGLLTQSVLDTFLAVAIILVPCLIIFDLPIGAGNVVALIPWILLSLAAALPLGLAIGSVAKGPRAVGGWGFLLIGGITAISGIFYPIQALWGWLQTLAQLLPVYWAGHGMRSALLPDSAADAELTESWRTLEAAGVLGAWAVAGLLLAPILLGRMASRESGSAVEESRQRALQRI